MIPAPRHFLMRLRRDGPLVGAKLWWDDAEPGEPDNKLDRGRLSVYPRAAIAGAEVPPEQLLDRLNVWQRGDIAPVYEPERVDGWLAEHGNRTTANSHWKFCQPIDEPTYRYHFDRLRWAGRHRPSEPALHPRRAVDPAQLPLPDFTRERSI